MRALLKFMSFLKDRQYAVEDLKQFAELIEPLELPDGVLGYRLKPLREADRVTQRCRVLVHFTWHCRDYVLRILDELGIANRNEVVNRYIRASLTVQAMSYLANDHKHAGIEENKQRWALDIAPRYGKPYVLGQLLDFPFPLKPTVLSWGESLPGIEFTGRAGIGEQVLQFERFNWKYSCNVEDKDGNLLGNAWDMCELTFQTWIKVLSDHGIAV